MATHPNAGLPVTSADLPDIPRLISQYYVTTPDPCDPVQSVSFGTSGHRGTSLDGSFNEDHIVAVAYAVRKHRVRSGITGPLFLGRDTHALSEPAHTTALEVLAACGVEVRVAPGQQFTPTPAVSHAILCHNRAHPDAPADGLILTPSHNPPDAGGIKYNPPSGGPADAAAAEAIAAEANGILQAGTARVPRLPYRAALQADCVQELDFLNAYVADLASVLDMEAIARSGLRLGADALGGSGLGYWAPIADRYGLTIDVLNAHPDPTFRFMCLDHDGKIRMDCSSACAMQGLIKLRNDYDLAFGNDPDFDRHGIVTPEGGLMNPNHYLSVAVDYLYRNRPGWSTDLGVGKTVVTSSMVARVAGALNRPLYEVPVGFKWFVAPLLDGQIGFGGEESAGASFQRLNGTVWTTDKDGIILCLLAAEMMARTDSDPAARYRQLAEQHGASVYQRTEAPATREQKALLKKLDAGQVRATELAGDPILHKLTAAPGNNAPIGGLKVETANGWFAARPSGTEDIYKIYAESFRDGDHLAVLLEQAQSLVDGVFRAAGIG